MIDWLPDFYIRGMISERAGAEETAAVRIASSLYRHEINLDQAIESVKKAIAAGDAEALGLAALLHHERLSGLVEKMPFTASDVYEESKAVISILSEYRISVQTGSVKSDGRLTDQLTGCARHAAYCHSFMLYWDNNGRPADIDKVSEMIKDDPGTRARLLYGAVLAANRKYGKAMPVLEAGLRDSNYRAVRKDYMENTIYRTAVLVTSEFARRKRDFEKAFTILRNGISGITDAEMRHEVSKEAGKYRRGLLGVLEYNG